MTKDEITNMLNELNQRIGRNIRLFRNKRDMSIRELAKLIGVTYQQVSYYERGNDKVSSARLYLIAKALKVNISTLIANDTNVTQ